MKFNKKTFMIIFSIMFSWFCVHVVFITIDGLEDENLKADIAVILGNKVNEDGSLSERLKKRMECGLDLFHKGRVSKIIVSGGLGKEGFYEGDRMKAFLLEHNVPDTAIIVDNKGNNTRATVSNVLSLKDSLNYKSLIVVSQYFHLTRTKMLFRKQGMNNVSSVSPNYFEIRDLYSVFREFVAYYVG